MNTEEVDPHLTAKIVRSYVRHHRLGPDQLPDLVASVHRAIGQLGQPPRTRRGSHSRCIGATVRPPGLCDLSRLRLPREDAATAYQHSARFEPR